MPEPRERLLQVFLEQEARVIGADGDSHGERLYMYAFSFSFSFELTVRAELELTLIAHDPTVVISARGEERLRGGHPWIYRADVADVARRGRRHRAGAQPARPARSARRCTATDRRSRCAC